MARPTTRLGRLQQAAERAAARAAKAKAEADKLEKSAIKTAKAVKTAKAQLERAQRSTTLKALGLLLAHEINAYGEKAVRFWLQRIEKDYATNLSERTKKTLHAYLADPNSIDIRDLSLPKAPGGGTKAQLVAPQSDSQNS